MVSSLESLAQSIEILQRNIVAKEVLGSELTQNLKKRDGKIDSLGDKFKDYVDDVYEYEKHVSKLKVTRSFRGGDRQVGSSGRSSRRSHPYSRSSSSSGRHGGHSNRNSSYSSSGSYLGGGGGSYNRDRGSHGGGSSSYDKDKRGPGGHPSGNGKR